MKANEIRQLSNDELMAKLDDARQELMNLRFQTVTGQATDTSRVKIVRRDIARLMTILRQRELGLQEEK
jgi:large subunit ribosomal protein L29